LTAPAYTFLLNQTCQWGDAAIRVSCYTVQVSASVLKFGEQPG